MIGQTFRKTSMRLGFAALVLGTAPIAAAQTPPTYYLFEANSISIAAINGGTDTAQAGVSC
jgi:hypothetical protein